MCWCVCWCRAGGQRAALGARDPAPPPAGSGTKEPMLRKSRLSTGPLNRFFFFLFSKTLSVVSVFVI